MKSPERQAAPTRRGSRLGRKNSRGGEVLAIHGGTPVVGERDQPVPERRWGDSELTAVAAALRQDSLFYWRGAQTEKLLASFRRECPLRHVMPCSSGTASLHIALLAMNLEPGDEVITSPITDQGTVIGILYQQGVPVFADVGLGTYNLDPESVAARITPRTKAIIAVHLAGNPCHLAALKALADRHRLILIEDCAQAWGARYRGDPIGTHGHMGCFSLNDYKHISCGDGGLVATGDESLGMRLQRCGDKAYDRTAKTRSPEFLAPCYRMSELQAAVASVQVSRVEEIARRRNQAGESLTKRLSEIGGIRTPEVDERDFCSYWFYMFRLAEREFRCGNGEFVEALVAEGVPASAGYIPEPLYRFPVFRERSFFGGRWPVFDQGLTSMDYREVICPNAEKVLKTTIRIEVREWMASSYWNLVADAIRKVADSYRK